MGVVVESMWVSVTNWFTPTVLFCILNLTIGTIFISSRLRTSYSKEKHENHEHGREAFLGTGGTSAPLLFRAPSTLLERVKSINLSFQYRSSDQAPDPLLFPPHDADISQEDRGVQHQHQHEDDEEARELHSESHHVTRRSKSETCVAVPKTAAAEKRKTKMMKKSVSEKIVSLEKEKEEEEEKEDADVVDRRRPATTRERNKPTNVVVDEAVDEKADDFINRFRQQLKLQRLESILRYKEMLNRGAGR